MWPSENLLHFFCLNNGRLRWAPRNARSATISLRTQKQMTGNKTTQSASAAGKNRSPLISDEKFRELYSALLQCRMLDQQLQTYPLYEQWPGREAATAGVVACLRSGDSVAQTPHGLLASHLRRTATDLITKKRPDSAKGVALAQQLAEASKDALRHKLEKRGRIAVIFAAPAKPEHLREIFAAAAKDALPFFCILDSSVALTDIPAIRVDGSDAIAVYRVAHESIKRAREGGGPTIMECAQWPDENELQDPLEKLEKYLTRKKIFRANWKRQLEQKYQNVLYDVLIGSELRARQSSRRDSSTQNGYTSAKEIL